MDFIWKAGIMSKIKMIHFQQGIVMIFCEQARMRNAQGKFYPILTKCTMEEFRVRLESNSPPIEVTKEQAERIQDFIGKNQNDTLPSNWSLSLLH